MSLMKKTSAAFLALILGASSLSGVAYADPPPWAPAHGYRDRDRDRDRRHDWDEHYYYEKHSHRRPYHYYEGRNHVAYAVMPQYAVTEVDCSRVDQTGQLLGAIIGGATGGIVGNQFGKGHGRDVATIGGAIAGLLVGSNIGTQFNTTIDQRCAGQVLETAQTGSQIAWRNPDNDATYSVVPTKTFQNEGRYCREYQSVATIGGKARQTYGTACRQPDGSWEVVSQQ